ncbi:N-acetyl-D-glucosamine ABC transport system [Gracilibacillus boraciitolerans JCM 21714]|uniref:N-acetyl-D-glucosamine ABC transport system n=1 Tax=Gracilibacillus boraciitolerans JCM 21714 TaxID=1298598 RepID=W4VPD6_9BACI|nr:N-acetyl-D-glucosamine ABC transport system [Gracilibacillus boraciitolerans JCM 21714]
MDTALRKRRFLCAALIPTMLVYSLFVIVPIIWSIYYGFFNWKGIGDATFIGMANYIEVLQDSIFWLSLKNNLIIVGASVFFQVPIALVLALLLTRTTWFQKFVRTSVFMPMVLSSLLSG